MLDRVPVASLFATYISLPSLRWKMRPTLDHPSDPHNPTANESVMSEPEHPQRSEQNTITVPFPLKLTLALLPIIGYGIAVVLWGFSGMTRAIADQATGDFELAALSHAVPIVWLMISPLFLVPGIVRRPPQRVRDWFTPELSTQFAPGDVCLAAGAHTSMQFDVRDIDEVVVATGKCATAPLPSVMQIEVGNESHYEAEFDWAEDPAESGWTDHRGRQLRVVRRYADPNQDDAILLTYVRTCFHSEPHLIHFNGAPDLWLKPNPACSFPRVYDMVVEDEVVGQVRLPGRFLFCGVMVLSNHYPPGVRAVLAAACYQMMRG